MRERAPGDVPDLSTLFTFLHRTYLVILESRLISYLH